MTHCWLNLTRHNLGDEKVYGSVRVFKRCEKCHRLVCVGTNDPGPR